MLKKTKNENIDLTRAPSPIPEGVPSSVSAAGKTIIGKQLSIEGGIHGGEDLVIEGTVKGNIELGKFHLTIGPKGKVEAEIMAGNITISGQLKGNIKAIDKVEITKDADFNGEIKARRISVEDGACLKAVIDVEREPQPVGKAIDSPVPGAGKAPIPLVSEADKRK